MNNKKRNNKRINFRKEVNRNLTKLIVLPILLILILLANIPILSAELNFSYFREELEYCERYKDAPGFAYESYKADLHEKLAEYTDDGFVKFCYDNKCLVVIIEIILFLMFIILLAELIFAYDKISKIVLQLFDFKERIISEKRESL